jgi:uncharacterized protein (DUF1697 family)
MTVIVSMLRAVNVGGHNLIKMDALRALYGSLKLRDAQTYVQSGNVVFRTDERDLLVLRERIQNKIERSFGFRPELMLRTIAEMRHAIAKNPFAGRRGIEPNKLLVTFLAKDPGVEARHTALQIKASEEMHILEREVYIYFPNGMARPKLSWPVVERILKTSGTARNWNTVSKLLEIAEKLEALD